MSEKNPMMEFQVNTPETIKTVKNFKNGTNSYGQYFGWEIEHDGARKTYFPTEEIHNFMTEHPIGTHFVVNKKEMKPKGGGKSYFQFTINEAVFDGQGKIQKQPPDLRDNEEAMEDYRKSRKNEMYQALADAADVVHLYNSSPLIHNGILLTGEDVRSIAIHFRIELERK